MRHCKTINNKYGTKEAWNAINDLKRGLSKTKPYANKQMKRPDGSICLTPEENSEVFYEHFRTLYGRHAHYDESVLDALPQQPVYEGCDYLPTNQEIRDATHKLKNKAPGESGIMAPVWKSLLYCRETFNMLRSIVINFWRTEVVPDEWNTGRLFILPKKGDLSLPKNYRGIMLLELAYKIIDIYSPL